MAAKASTRSKKMKSNIQNLDNNNLYIRSVITRHITLPINKVTKEITSTFAKYIKEKYEGKCIVEGFVKPGTSKINTYSSGKIMGDQIVFEVLFECYICNVVEDMILNCKAINITKAGIRAEIKDETPSPLTIFITRDQYFNNKYFASIKENDDILVKVIGCRFELNDKYISVIGGLVPKK